MCVSELVLANGIFHFHVVFMNLDGGFCLTVKLQPVACYDDKNWKFKLSRIGNKNIPSNLHL